MLKKINIRVTKKDQSSEYMPGLVNLNQIKTVMPSGVDGVLSIVFDFQGGTVLAKADMEDLIGIIGKKK